MSVKLPGALGHKEAVWFDPRLGTCYDFRNRVTQSVEALRGRMTHTTL